MSDNNDIMYTEEKYRTMYFTNKLAVGLCADIINYIKEMSCEMENFGICQRCIPEKLSVSVSSTPKSLHDLDFIMNFEYQAQVIFRFVTFPLEELPKYKERHFHICVFGETLSSINEQIEEILSNTQWDTVPIDLSLVSEAHAKHLTQGIIYTKTVFTAFLLYEIIFTDYN